LWEGNEYVYTKGMLKRIALSYQHIYQGIEGLSSDITNDLEIAEYKADFDRALNEIGRGEWTGEIDYLTFRDFKYFGRLQRMVIADIYGMTEPELKRLGFINISKRRNYAYTLMVKVLNGT
jgi:hypothetical protein